jgi:hypothetical protein
MLKNEVECAVVILDSITSVTPDDVGAIIVSASHGGASSCEFALGVPLKAVFFNDAGLGKDDAGIAALSMLQAKKRSGRRGRAHECGHRQRRGHVGLQRDLARQRGGPQARAFARSIAARGAEAVGRGGLIQLAAPRSSCFV